MVTSLKHYGSGGERLSCPHGAAKSFPVGTVKPVKVEAESPQQYMNRTQQQAMRALGRKIQNAASQVYALGGCASNAYLRGSGIRPKEYGLWLAQTGKNKHNNRRNKHFKKMRSW